MGFYLGNGRIHGVNVVSIGSRIKGGQRMRAINAEVLKDLINKNAPLYCASNPDMTEEEKEMFYELMDSFSKLIDKVPTLAPEMSKARAARLLSGFIDVLAREMCLNKEIAAKLADDYLNIKSLTSKEYL